MVAQIWVSNTGIVSENSSEKYNVIYSCIHDCKFHTMYVYKRWNLLSLWWLLKKPACIIFVFKREAVKNVAGCTIPREQVSK